MGEQQQRLTGKVAIVTGAGRGIGRAHARALAAEGALVVVNDLGVSVGGEREGPSPAEAVVSEIIEAGGQAMANGADVSDDAGAEALVGTALQEYGRLDILVNNAGILRDRMLVNMTLEDWDRVMQIHLTGHFLPLKHAAAHWRERSKSEGGPVFGRVINTSSSSGTHGNAGQANYAAAKAGIAALTIVAARELGRYGVTVNALAPTARTRMTEGLVAEVEGGFDVLDPENNSPIVVALCTDDAQGVTGRCFLVHGGLISPLQGWQLGPVYGVKEQRWDVGDLVEVLREVVPQGPPSPDAIELEQLFEHWDAAEAE